MTNVVALHPKAAQAAYQAESDIAAAKRRLGVALPDDGWLGEYVRACVPLTDAPVEFHLATGLGALSAAIGNRAWADAWGQKTYPHLWIVVVAASSFWRKSTSINLAEGLLREQVPEACFPNDFSREKFLRVLEGQPWGLLTLKEFGSFLAVAGKDYNSGLKEALTELYDGPSTFKRSLQSGDVTVSNPAITILGASTLDWLESKVSANDLGSGFIPRFVFVTASEKASAKGMTGSMDQAARGRLGEGLRRIADRGPSAAAFDPAAKDRLDDWMFGWEAEAAQVAHSVDVSSFANRLQTAAVKLSMLYSLSGTAHDLSGVVHVDDRSAERAIAYARQLYRSVTDLVDNRIATSRTHQVQRQIGRIASGRGTSWSNLLRLMHMNARDLRPYVETMVETGDLVREERTPGEVGIERQRQRPMEWLRAATGSARVHGPDGDSANHRPIGFANGSLLTGSEPEGRYSEANPSEPYLSSTHTDSLTVHEFPQESARPRHVNTTRAREPEPEDPTVGLPVDDPGEDHDAALPWSGPEL